MSQTLPSISVIIVTWNALELLQKYLPSVVRHSNDAQIIIADNQSTDETAHWVSETYPNCTVVTHDKNYGYCGGNNRAVEAATGDILLFLNNDVEVSKDWLKPIQKAFTLNNNGAVQPKMLSHRDPSSFEYAGAAGGMIDHLGYPFCRGRVFDSLEKDFDQYNDAAEIFWASGAALAVRKDLFKTLGGFDERFEFHMEEIDLCWRIQRSGYTIKYEPRSTVYHLGGGSLPTGSARKTYYNFRNNLLMLHKNMNSGDLKRIGFKKRWLDYLAMLQFVMKGDIELYKALRKARRDAYMMIKKFDLTNESPLPKPDLISLSGVLDRSIIFEYFIKNHKTYDELSS